MGQNIKAVPSRVLIEFGAPLFAIFLLFLKLFHFPVSISILFYPLRFNIANKILDDSICCAFFRTTNSRNAFQIQLGKG